MKELKKCMLCPRMCQVNRYQEKGFCGCNAKLKVALAKLFFYEEPPISGKNGSGAIFFSGCNLKCCFCQNHEISTTNKGQTISIKRLSEIMLELQDNGAHNINLVTPTMYIPHIKKAIIKAKEKGLTIPIIYNSSGYENSEALKLLDGLIDVYLPDFKYFDNHYAMKYSKAPNYSLETKKAIQEMYRQVGPCLFNKDGLIKKGIIVRHLALPSLLEDSKKIINYLYQTYHGNIYLSIMNQYTPNQYVSFKELQSPLKEKDYNNLVDYAYDLGITKAFCQEGGTISDSFVPNFNYDGVRKKLPQR